MGSEDEVSCGNCGSKQVEEWGESGTFWLHCYACGHDGPDLPESPSSTPPVKETVTVDRCEATVSDGKLRCSLAYGHSFSCNFVSV